MNRDVMIFTGLLLTGVALVVCCVRSRMLFTKLGFLLSAIATCVGLAYFGWQPLFGGSHEVNTWGGAITLTLGLFGFCLFGAIEEVVRRMTSPTDQRRGFPAVLPLDDTK